MIKLYGLKMSNYYSLVKAVLIEKGLEFEEVKAPPTQKEDNLARSPMGKMPSIEVDGQYMSESLAIALYLEQLSSNNPLLPADPFQAGKVMELICHIKLDAELVARRCIAEAFFGGTVSDETKESTDKDLQRGLQAVDQLMVCAPYAAGDTFTLADMYTYYSFGFINGTAQKMFNKDILAEYPKIAALMETLAERPAMQRVAAEQ
ncbi:MAG: glutathione S-transferase family protein [Gammaproteobacteria bacterium TMED92]|nr:MAG: glutathione S-transferase family protein [Gammaproteobacteria bacterium TMED92]